MNTRSSCSRTGPGLALLTGLAAVVCAAVISVAQARDHVDGFDSPQTSWIVSREATQVRLLSHRRHGRITQTGPASEAFEFDGLADQATVRCELPLPHCRVIEELTASLWVRSNHEGARLAVRVVFPHQTLPGSEDLLAVVVDGESYSTAGSWQQIRCQNIEAELRRKLPQLRARLLRGSAAQHDLDMRGLYLDRLYVRVPVSRGSCELFLDELKLGPVVPIVADENIQLASQSQTAPTRELELRLDRLQFRGKPFFPRIVPHHGEPASELAAQRFNLAWIANSGNRAVLEELQAAGLRAIATPPRPRGLDGQTLTADQASLAPFSAETEGILFWMLGSEINGSLFDQVSGWTEQVRQADRLLNRPVTADVQGRLRSFSRQMNLLGTSRRPLHSTLSFRDYRDWLLQRRQLAQPGTLLWTTVQTEGMPITGGSVAGLKTVVEPEQIRLQVYAALAAGSRGICYWTEAPLTEPAIAADERRLQIAQLNMELELLEPWLATSSLQTQAPIVASIRPSGNFSQLNVDFGVSDQSRIRRRELVEESADSNLRSWNLGLQLEAASLRSDFGQLLLPVWYGAGSQFVPDQLATNDAAIVIPGATESASVYEVSTTDIRNISPPRKQRVAGGLKVTLDKFDLTAALVLTEDRTLVDRLRAKMESMREESARTTLALARAKLVRVNDIDRQLHLLGVGQTDAARLLASAQSCVDRAESMLGQQQFHESRLLSQNCLQLLRILQRAYWNDAVRNLSSPVVSPYAVCFQTLPEHWEFVRRLGRASTQPVTNLLPAGDFEDYNELLSQGLKHEQHPQEGLQAIAEHYPKSVAGEYCLRLKVVSERGTDPPRVIAESPIRVTSPAATIDGRRIVLLSALVNIPKKPTGSVESVLVYDTYAGRDRAVRVVTGFGGWQKVELIREVVQPTPISLVFELSGLGEVQIDELKILAYPLPTLNRVSAPLASPLDSRSLQTFDLLKKLPSLPNLDLPYRGSFRSPRANPTREPQPRDASAPEDASASETAPRKVETPPARAATAR